MGHQEENGMRLIELASPLLVATALASCATNARSPSDVEGVQAARDDARAASLEARRDAQMARFEAERATQAERGATSRSTEGLTGQGQMSGRTEWQASGIMTSVEFGPNSADVSSDAKTKIDGILADLGTRVREARFMIEGLADDTPTEATNAQLSARRASQVAKYIESKGVPVNQVAAYVSTPSGGARLKNRGGTITYRRADIFIFTQINQVTGP
jgi:outer membrane protein OmpA-like peptidoglycan-associated protein